MPATSSRRSRWSDPPSPSVQQRQRARSRMRRSASLSFVGLALSATPAFSATPNDDAGAEASYSSGVSTDEVRRRSVGLMFDLGTLDGGMMSLVYRPAPWLRVHAGGGTNGASPGVRAGAVIPFSPRWSVSMEGGHFFPGDLNGVFSAFAGAGYDDSYLLENFDYDFANLQLGWEVEKSDLLFFVRAGVGYVWSQVPSEGLPNVENLSSLVDADGRVQVFMPSLKLGFIGFL